MPFSKSTGVDQSELSGKYCRLCLNVHGAYSTHLSRGVLIEPKLCAVLYASTSEALQSTLRNSTYTTYVHCYTYGVREVTITVQEVPSHMHRQQAAECISLRKQLPATLADRELERQHLEASLEDFEVKVQPGCLAGIEVGNSYAGKSTGKH